MTPDAPTPTTPNTGFPNTGSEYVNSVGIEWDHYPIEVIHTSLSGLSGVSNHPVLLGLSPDTIPTPRRSTHSFGLDQVARSRAVASRPDDVGHLQRRGLAYRGGLATSPARRLP